MEVGSAVSEVGKWERAADIRTWPGRRMQAVRWGAAAPSFQIKAQSAERDDSQMWLVH